MIAGKNARRTAGLYFGRACWGLLIGLALAACATGGFNSTQNIQQLHQGMSYDEVVNLLGRPESQSVGSKGLVAKFWLHEAWKGNVPYDLTFHPTKKTLISWKEDEKGYQQSQAKLGLLASVLKSAEESSKSGGGSMVPNDPQLMQYFSGQWYGFSGGGYGSSGGTERRLTLCSDGTYRMNSESGYSGSGWGTASQGGNDGKWTIQGNRNQGKISMNGTTYDYSSCGNGCVVINGVKMAYESQANCN